MRITKYTNSYFPEKDFYQCTIGDETRCGTLEQVTTWRDHQMANHEYYRKIEELDRAAIAAYYEDQSFNYKGD